MNNSTNIKITDDENKIIFEIDSLKNSDNIKFKNILNDNKSYIEFILDKINAYYLLAFPLSICIAEDMDTNISTRLFFKKYDPELQFILKLLKSEIDDKENKEIIMLYLRFSIRKDLENDNTIDLKINYELSFLKNEKSMQDLDQVKLAMKNKFKPKFQFQPKNIKLSNYDALNIGSILNK